MVAQGKVTTDRNLIEKWANARMGCPAMRHVMTSTGMEAMLSIVFPVSEQEEMVRFLSWEEFFEILNRLKLVFMYEDLDPHQQPSFRYALG